MKSDKKHTPTHGSGGELHQTAGRDVPVLTTQQGVPVSDDQNSLRIGTRGPTALEDLHFREKIFHFDHERIPERVVHARGFGAHGFFENYRSLSAITSADLFQRAGEKTPAFVRFSTVAGNKGSADLARDVRGFAVKLYTKQGNWDIVGNNMPIFFIQDAIKFPDLIHAAKQAPDRDFPQAQTAHDNFWDLISLMPESIHMIMWIMSDRAIPRSFRFMEGFGIHTFRLVSTEGKSTFVKFHWKPGGPNFTHIPVNAPKCPMHLFQQDGHMAMKNPVGRVNYEPNSRGAEGGPRECPQTGFRSFPAEESGPKVRERSASFADHYSQARQFYISQTKSEQGHIADALIFELSKVEEPAIRERMVSHLPLIDAGLGDRVAKGLGISGKIHPAEAAMAPRQDLKKSPALSIALNPPASFAGRKVGVLVTEGADASVIEGLRQALKGVGATLEIVAPTIGGVKTSDGKMLKADHKIGGGPSVLFDAVALCVSEDGVAALAKNAAAAGWVAAARPLMDKAGATMDAGFIDLGPSGGATAFVASCGELRLWERENTVNF